LKKIRSDVVWWFIVDHHKLIITVPIGTFTLIFLILIALRAVFDTLISTILLGVFFLSLGALCFFWIARKGIGREPRFTNPERIIYSIITIVTFFAVLIIFSSLQVKDFIKTTFVGTLTPIPTVVATDTPTPTLTPSLTPTFTLTPGDTPTFTYTPSNTPPTSTPTSTLTNTPTITPTPTLTFTPSITPTPTVPQITVNYSSTQLSFDSTPVPAADQPYSTAETACAERGARLPSLSEWSEAANAGIFGTSVIWEWTSTANVAGSHETGRLNSDGSISAVTAADDGTSVFNEFLGFRCVTP